MTASCSLRIGSRRGRGAPPDRAVRAAAAADGAGRDRADAVRDVLDGDVTRLVAVDEAIDRLDATGHHLFAALFRRERALLLPHHPRPPASARAAAAWV